jgi:peptidoglycan hydrolase-like protein with peptidoglycan-binding domain
MPDEGNPEYYLDADIQITEVDEPEAEVVEEVVIDPVAPMQTKKSAGGVPPTEYAVTGEGDTDEVHLSKIVYMNRQQRRVLSVFHVQRRLGEWGFTNATAEKPGWYGEVTKDSVAAFQKQLGLTETGIVDAETLTRLFEGDTNVTVIL